MKNKTLSHDDTQRLNEIISDKRALELTFDTFICRHHNCLKQITDTDRDLWTHFREAYDLDPDKEYKAKFSNLDRRFCIVEVITDITIH